MADRYYKFSRFLCEKYGQKVWKICVDAGLSCPNRDPVSGKEGCIFCRNDSFSHMYSRQNIDIAEQIENGLALGRGKMGIEKFIVYFQSSTNTFAPVPLLRQLFFGALSHPGVVGLSIATRPDCLSPPVIELLAELALHTDLWIELGLQSAHDATLQRIGRGHTFADYCQAVENLLALPLRICTHVMIGLFEENEHHVHQTAEALAASAIHEVKIHPLLILRDTPLEALYMRGEIRELNLQTYSQQVCDFLERLPEDRVIQRLTAEAPAEQLLAPEWAKNKLSVLNSIDREMMRRNSWQGIARGAKNPLPDVF
ncbi:TIGR01212 family radical SAM protein [candidate division KSB1 bacterium]|nr:TIGR01212 family radical SAM protein [candidate division KSB1 bacterium]